MTSGDIGLLVVAAVLVVVAGFFSAADAALSSFSRVRAEEIAAEGRSGSRRLLEIVDDPPRYLNTTLFLRMLCEITAIVLVTVVMLDLIDHRWWSLLAAAGIMLVVSFVVIGVAPRTVGRQHAEDRRAGEYADGHDQRGDIGTAHRAGPLRAAGAGIDLSSTTATTRRVAHLATGARQRRADRPALRGAGPLGDQPGL